MTACTRDPDQSRPAGAATYLADRMRPARALKPGMGLIANRAYAAPAGGSGAVASITAVPISPGLLGF